MKRTFKTFKTTRFELIEPELNKLEAVNRDLRIDSINVANGYFYVVVSFILSTNTLTYTGNGSE
jgi:hypothetical protein